jgi:electron transfer flavoprotein alpha subunit
MVEGRVGLVMKIIVPIKQVPETDEQRYDPATRTLAREGVTSVINAYDKRALTEAIRLRAVYGGSVTAITMGPAQAREALVECLGRGVDKAIHVTDRAFAGSDTLATARTLAAALRRFSFDLLLLGKFSTDSETGQVGPELAELLDLPQVTGVTAIEMGEGGTLRLERETDTGLEVVECALPALLTAAERLIKPVKSKPELIEEGRRRVEEEPDLIEIWGAYELGIATEESGLTGSPTWVAELRGVEIERERRILLGGVDDAVGVMLAELEARGLRGGKRAGRSREGRLPEQVEKPRSDRSVWAVAEFVPEREGEKSLRRISLELAGEAARLAAEVGGEAAGVVMGSRVGAAHLEEMGRHGTRKVLVADDEKLIVGGPEGYAWVLARAIEEYMPWAVLMPATAFGRDIAPRVAARLGLGLTGDCIGFEVDGEGRLLQLKPAFGGQVIAPIISRTVPVMSTVRPGVLPVLVGTEKGRPEVQVIRLSTEGLPEQRSRLIEVRQEGEAGLSLDAARLVVCGGRGIGGPEALPEVYEFAARLGKWMGLDGREVAVAGTRKVVDEGWLPWHQQVGLTGRSVSPDLYVGLGVQGNFNHTSGILGSGVIVGVNHNADAAIFEACDLGVVADWREFVESVKRKT